MGHRALLAYRRDDDSTGDSTDGSAGTACDSTDATADSADATDTLADDEMASDDEMATDDETPTDEPTYDLHRSHWGGADFALLGRLSADSPFAAETSFAVDPEPVATDLSLSEIVTNHLDFLHHEAFYRVSMDYETTAFHVLWFGLEADAETVERSETVGHGALVEAVPDDANYLRGWFRGTKAVVGAMVDGTDPVGNREAVTPDEAADYLAERVETWSEDREVLLPE